MKKLFVSVPIRDRTEDNIRKSIEKMHKIAEIVFDEKLEVIPTYIKHKPPQDCKEAVWYLGQSILKLAEADYFIGISDGGNYFRGCNTESDIAYSYEIKSHYVPCSIFPDADEIEKNILNAFRPKNGDGE